MSLDFMSQCPSSSPLTRSQTQIEWYPDWDCDGNTGNRDKLEKTRYKCYWGYTVNGQQRW